MRPALVGPAYSKRGSPTGCVTCGPAGGAPPRWARANAGIITATRKLAQKRAIGVVTGAPMRMELRAYVYHAWRIMGSFEIPPACAFHKRRRAGLAVRG